MIKAKKKPRYVLIMEDNSAHAELLTETLDHHFSPVIIHTVDTFKAGLEFLTRTPYRLIITESVVSGERVENRLKEIIKKHKRLPVIVITGRGNESLAVKLTRMGATEYLVKTRETLDTLPHILEKYLS